jgi:hypothetical protein
MHFCKWRRIHRIDILAGRSSFESAGPDRALKASLNDRSRPFDAAARRLSRELESLWRSATERLRRGGGHGWSPGQASREACEAAKKKPIHGMTKSTLRNARHAYLGSTMGLGCVIIERLLASISDECHRRRRGTGWMSWSDRERSRAVVLCSLRGSVGAIFGFSNLTGLQGGRKAEDAVPNRR